MHDLIFRPFGDLTSDYAEGEAIQLNCVGQSGIYRSPPMLEVGILPVLTEWRCPLPDGIVPADLYVSLMPLQAPGVGETDEFYVEVIAELYPEQIFIDKT